MAEMQDQTAMSDDIEINVTKPAPPSAPTPTVSWFGKTYDPSSWDETLALHFAEYQEKAQELGNLRVSLKRLPIKIAAHETLLQDLKQQVDLLLPDDKEEH